MAIILKATWRFVKQGQRVAPCLLAMVLYAEVALAGAAFTPVDIPDEWGSSWSTSFYAPDDGRSLYVRGSQNWFGGPPYAGVYRWNPTDGLGPPMLVPVGFEPNGAFPMAHNFDGSLSTVWFGPEANAGGLWRDSVAVTLSEATGAVWGSGHDVADHGRIVGEFDWAGQGTEIGLWSEAVGFEPIEVASDWPSTSSLSISRDGSTVFGLARDAHRNWNWRWVRGEGVSPLPDEVPAACGGGRLQIGLSSPSDDGKVAYESLYFGVKHRELTAIRWTEEEGLTCITGFDDPGLPDEIVWVHILDATGDGKTALGHHLHAFDPDPPYFQINRSFLWDEENGVQYLDEIFEAHPKLEIEGWSRLQAHNLSADGRVITGDGIGPDGRTRPFMFHRWFEREDLRVEIGTNLAVRFFFHPIGHPIEATVFGAEDVDVRDIVADSLAVQHEGAALRVGDARPPVHHLTVEDVDRDGHDDLLVYLSGEDAGVSVSDDTLCLRGLIGEQRFEACSTPDPNHAWCGDGFWWAVVPVVAVYARGRTRHATPT